MYLAIFLAVAAGNDWLWRHIFTLRPNIFRRTGSGRNLLHIAVKSRNLDCIETILGRGYTDLIHCTDTMGESPISLAQQMGLKEAVDVFDLTKNDNIKGNKEIGCNLKQSTGQEVISNLTNNQNVNQVRAWSAKMQNRLVSTSNTSLLARQKSQKSKKIKALIDPEVIHNSTSGPLCLPSMPFTTFPLSMPRLSGVYNHKPSSSAPNLSSPEPPKGPAALAYTKSEPKERNSSYRRLTRNSSLDDISFQKPCGVQQVVFLPPWRRDCKNQKTDEKPEQIKKAEDKSEDSIGRKSNAQQAER